MGNFNEPDGLRVELQESAGLKRFLYDDQAYLAEADASESTKVVYTQEPTLYGNIVSQYRKNGAIWTPAYYHQDSFGSTRELSDSLESVTDRYLSNAWGKTITTSGSTANSFLWIGNVGYYYDTDTGNFYVRARTYRPTIGRWLSEDPLQFVDGMNVYVPYFVPNSIDPSGMRRRCFNPCEENGCGPKGRWLRRLIPNRPIPFGGDFTKCCNEHDLCYCICGIAKSACDLAFLDCMVAECNRRWPRFQNRFCRNWAAHYALAVHRFGGGAFSNAQNVGCANCECDQDWIA